MSHRLAGRKIEDPAKLVHSRGQLHDVEIVDIRFQVEEQIVCVEVADLNANFRNPGGAPCWPCSLIFGGVAKVFLDVHTWEGIRISEANIKQGEDGLALEIFLNLGGARGGHHIVIAFQTLEIIDHFPSGET